MGKSTSTYKKTVTKTTGVGGVKEYENVVKPTAPKAYKQDTYKPNTYTGTYNPNTYKSAYTPGTYASKYEQQIADSMNALTNWKYDPMQDASYQALAKVYNAQGNIAAKNSLADAAALNGGYGSSFAVSAAQQARNQYNQQLAQHVPELEQAAYNRANNVYNIYRQADDTDYGRFRDTEGDRQWQEQHNLNVFNTNESNRYNAANFAKDTFFGNEDNRYKAAQYNQSERQYATSQAYQKYRDLMSDYQWGKNYNLDIYSMLKAEEEARKASSGGGRSGGGGGGYSGGYSSGGYYDDALTQIPQIDKKSGSWTAKTKPLVANKTSNIRNQLVRMSQ